MTQIAIRKIADLNFVNPVFSPLVAPPIFEDKVFLISSKVIPDQHTGMVGFGLIFAALTTIEPCFVAFEHTRRVGNGSNWSVRQGFDERQYSLFKIDVALELVAVVRVVGVDFSAFLFSFLVVGIVLSEGDVILPDVFEGHMRQSSSAAIILFRAVYDFLFGEIDRVAVFDFVVCLESADCGECVASVAVFLVFDGPDGAELSPVEVGWDLDAVE